MSKTLTFNNIEIQVPDLNFPISYYKGFIVYCLIDPSTKMPKYIGKSCSGRQRILHHYSNSSIKEGNTPKNNWIKSLKKQGLKYEHVILISLDSNSGNKQQLNEQLYKHEQELISLFKDKGFKLTNLADGGPGAAGYKRSEETRKKLSDAARSRPLPAALLEQQKPKGKPLKPKNQMPSYFRKRTGRFFGNLKKATPVYIMNPFTGEIQKIEGMKLAARIIGGKCNHNNIRRVLDKNQTYYGYYWMSHYE